MASSPRDNLTRGAALILISEALLALMSAAIKIVSLELPNEMAVFFRNLFGLMIIAPIALRHGPARLATRVPHLHLLRAVAGVGAMYCFFYTIAALPLAEAILFKLTAPFFIPLIAWLWLDERLPPAALGGILLGFVGIALVLRPGFRELPLAALVGLLGAALAGVAKVTIRRLGRSEPVARIVFYFGLLATLFTTTPLLWAWQTPSISAVGWLLLMGLCATGAQLALTRAYSIAPAGEIGPFTYCSVVFASLLGWAVWGEVPELLTVAGSLFIVAAGILTLRGGRAPPPPGVYNQAPADDTTTQPRQ